MWVDQGLKFVIDEIIGSGTYAIKMHLAKALPTPHDTTVTDTDLDAVEADYGGYAAQAVALTGAATINGSDEGVALTPTMTFHPTGLAAPQTIYAYWISATIGGTDYCLIYEELATPVVFTSDASQFQRVLNFYDENFNP